MSDLIAAAEAWIAADPDPATRSELRGLIDAGDLDALGSAMGGTLTFGTAGIRGRVGAGSNRMNRAVVIRTTAGLADYLLGTTEPGDRLVVIGLTRPISSNASARGRAATVPVGG